MEQFRLPLNHHIEADLQETFPHQRDGDGSTQELLRTILWTQKQLIEERRVSDRRREDFERRVLGELAAIRRQLAGPSTDPRAAFPQFSLLPLEIQQRIWELAIPRRLFAHMANREAYRLHCLSPPAIASVCRESRAIALKHGRIWDGGLYSHDFGFDDPENTVFNGGARVTWFTPATDILTLASRHKCRLESVAEHVFVDTRYIVPNDEKQRIRTVLGNREKSPNLRTIYAGEVIYVTHRWSPALVSELFDGIDSVVIVDLNDQKAVEKILTKFRNATCSDAVRAIEQLQSLKKRLLEENPNQEPPHQSLHEVVRQVVRGRADHRAGVSDLTDGWDDLFDGAGQPDVSIDWIRECLESLDILPVFIVALDGDKPVYDDRWYAEYFGIPRHDRI